MSERMSPWGWLAVILGSFFAVKAVKKGKTVHNPYTVDMWEPIIAALAVPKSIPVAFVQMWNQLESGGNPCAFGVPGAKGPDGNPRELGIGQLYNPDDLKLVGLTGNELRAYCVPGTQSVARMLTAEEMTAQARGLVDLIEHARTTVIGRLSSVGATWSHEGPDFWKMVKLVHALPGLVLGLPTVARFLGRAPRDWQDFVDVIPSVTFDHGTEGYRKEFPRILSIADRTGSAVKAPGVV